MKNLMVAMAMLMAVSVGAEQVVNYINLNKIVSLNVNETQTTFTLAGETDEEDEDEECRVSGSYSGEYLQLHMSNYFRVNTLRVKPSVLKMILDTQE